MTGVDLADFLLARISEDEAVARAATPGPWQVSGEHRESTVADSMGTPVLDAGGEYCGDLWLDAYDTDLAHIARWDPARVLAECEAKRRIVEMWQTSKKVKPAGWIGVRPLSRAHLDGCDDGLMLAVAYLAHAYADHPDYCEAWKP